MLHFSSETGQTTTAFHPDIEFMPRRELDLLQECLLARAVKLASTVPFYRERLVAFETIPDHFPLSRFQECVPLTTKQDLREVRDSAWVPAARPEIALLLATSGTTGTRIPLPYSKRDMDRWFSLVARTLWTIGLRPEDVVLLPVPVGLFTGGHAMLGGVLQLGCTVLPTGPVATPLVVEILRGSLGVVPTAIVTIPSHMLRLLDALPAAGYDPATSALRLACLGAEAWTEAARRRIEEGFQLRAVDSYGIGELCGPGVAGECELRQGMHIWEDAFLVEVVDPASGEPVPDGVPGEMVLTSLFREVLPLLRFRTGDEVFIVPEPCPCGRTHRRISRITRRLDKILVISGVNIDPGDIEQVLYAFPWVGHEFYIEAGGINHDTLSVHVEGKAGQPPPDRAEEQLIAAIRQHLPVRVKITLYENGRLERGTGKALRIRG